MNIHGEVLHVPYRGAALAVADLATGAVTMSFASLAAALPLIQADKLRAVAVTPLELMPQLPDVWLSTVRRPLRGDLIRGFGENCQFFERGSVHHDDDAILRLHDAAALPPTKTLVDALTARPADLSKLALREFNPQCRAARRTLLGTREPQQSVCKTRRQFQQSNLGNVLVGLPQPTTQDVHDLGPHLGMILKEGENVMVLKDRQAARSDRPGVGRPLLAVKQRNLAEYFPRWNDREHDLLAVGRRHTDAHTTAQNRHQAVAGGPHEEDGLAGRTGAHANLREQDISLFRFELAEEQALAEQAARFIS